MKTKVIILTLSLLMSCKTDREKELEKSIQARQDTVELLYRQADSLMQLLPAESSKKHRDSAEYNIMEDEQTCRN